ncbi:MAG: histidine--tRNA ligase [Oscillospiraceae bacterium]
MQPLTKAPKGTFDVLPKDINKWQTIEHTALEVATLFGFKEIRTPTFEHTELFLRSVGDTTDVVQKEMYTFNDKGNRSITLRPEGTAGVARAAIEHSIVNDALPAKLCYFSNCFRYERPQAGRSREFVQFGAEVFGADSPSADAEIISLANEIFLSLGVKNLSLEINSIGCKECRKEYHKALKAFFESKKDSLCPTCLERLDKNPMRILDCKVDACKDVAAEAPYILDYLCDDCKDHFEKLCERLMVMGIPYTVNPSIVRGLDYYTRTVFEFVSTDIGAQGTVCGGGRYDGLIEELGGPKTSGLGFGLGISRLILLMEAQGLDFMPQRKCDIYVAPIGDSASKKAVAIVNLLRREGFFAETDLVGRSVKAQMKYADKIGAAFTLVLGDNEIESGDCVLKNMRSGEQTPCKLESLLDTLYDEVIKNSIDGVCDSAENLGK